MIRDILLQLSSYPAPTAEGAFEYATALAKRHDARISVALCQVTIPRMSNFLANQLVGADQLIARENDLSRENARRLLAAFRERVPEAHRGEQILVDCTSFVTSSQVAVHARTFDLAILPNDGQSDRETLANDLIFGSGRPVLLLPVSGSLGSQRVVIGWDGSRAAARALADALPLLREARDVQLVTVRGEKPLGQIAGLDSARAHLERHGVAATSTEVDGAGSDAGTALLRHATDVGADLLVVGAFGHSRLREFILGGATRSIIAAATLPVLLSH